MNIKFADQVFYEIWDKIEHHERLTYQDGVKLYQSHDLAGIGLLADRVRRQRHGDQAFYINNIHLNYTNVCRNRCRFCAFARDEGAAGAFTLSLDDIKLRLEPWRGESIHEVHIVGGINPALPFDYYTDLLRTVREILPAAVIKAFTAVEIDHLAGISGLTLAEAINELKASGLALVPGGGAEIISDRLHRKLFPAKINGERWLEVMRQIHKQGIKSNATMLYGHLETIEERVNHLLRLRELQDETFGFSAFIPLAFHAKHTELDELPPVTACDDLKTIAVSRLLLDNIAHIKAYWVMIDPKLAQVALSYGADDLDGTIIEEKITHEAGAETAKGLTRDYLRNLILSAGLTPVERDSFYQSIEPNLETKQSAVKTDMIFQGTTVDNTERITEKQALELLKHEHLSQLGAVADQRKRYIHPEPQVTYVIDRNINYTNICVSGCRFCAFYKAPGHPEGYVIDDDTLADKIRETQALGGTQILLQGGMNPDLALDDYWRWLRFIKEFDIHIHGFSPPEILFIAQQAGKTISDTIRALVDAGLDSIPGGGAEILVDEVRSKISPNKFTADQWLAVMREAHRLGIKSSATMMFGHIETPEHIIAHLLKIRELQDETGGFTAFIPWTFQPNNTRIQVKPATSAEYLRVLALSRIVLDNIPNIQASYVTQGAKIAQTALFYGANDMGSTMIEENVVKAAGVDFTMPLSEILRLITNAGFLPVQRNFYYQKVNS